MKDIYPGSYIDICFLKPTMYNVLRKYILEKICYFCNSKLNSIEANEFNVGSFYEKFQCINCKKYYLIKQCNVDLSWNQVQFTINKYIVKLNEINKDTIKICKLHNNDIIISLPIFNFSNDENYLLKKIEKYILFG